MFLSEINTRIYSIGIVQEKSMKKNEMQQDIIPVWKRYVLTITEAAEYYHIGENKLRMIADEHPEADFIIMNGNRILIKRQKFEEFLDHATVV